MLSVAQKNYVTYEKNKKSVSFGFADALSSRVLAGGLEYLKQNPVAEVAFLDATTMIAPRTYTDYKQNPVYGTETLFREVAPVLFNPFGPGIVAALMMASQGYKGIGAGKDTIRSLHEAWKMAGGRNFHPETSTQEEKYKIIKKYNNLILENTAATTTNTTFNKLGKRELDSFSESLTDLMMNNQDKKFEKKLLSGVAEDYTLHTGAADFLKVKVGTEPHFSTDINTLLEDIVSVGKKFTTTLPEKLEGTVDHIVKFSKKKTLWATGLSIAGIITLPAINNAITRLRTGKSGYSAYQDFGKQEKTAQNNPEKKKNKAGLWLAKGIGAGILGSITLITMGAFSKNRGFFKSGGAKNFMDTIELKGKSAHMDLIKLIYGTSLVSRVLCSRDEQEVKVTTLRDSCGFLNWLVLGGFVTKGIAHLADKKGLSFVNITGPIVDKNANPIKAALKTASNWLSNLSLKTPSEIRAMNKNLPAATVNKNMAIHAAAIIGGFAWSMLVLGLGMPALNNFMTNKAREKQLKAKETENKNIKRLV
ncbi:MAG: hypothetical protein WCG23_03550 [bacterium]